MCSVGCGKWYDMIPNLLDIVPNSLDIDLLGVAWTWLVWRETASAIHGTIESSENVGRETRELECSLWNFIHQYLQKFICRSRHCPSQLGTFSGFAESKESWRMKSRLIRCSLYDWKTNFATRHPINLHSCGYYKMTLRHYLRTQSSTSCTSPCPT